MLKQLGGRVTGELPQVERQTAARPLNEGCISDEVLRKIELELDLTDSRLVLG